MTWNKNITSINLHLNSNFFHGKHHAIFRACKSSYRHHPKNKKIKNVFNPQGCAPYLSSLILPFWPAFQFLPTCNHLITHVILSKTNSGVAEGPAQALPPCTHHRILRIDSMWARTICPALIADAPPRSLAGAEPREGSIVRRLRWFPQQLSSWPVTPCPKNSWSPVWQVTSRSPRPLLVFFFFFWNKSLLWVWP